MAATRVTHQPNLPFGCGVSWGDKLFSNHEEARVHVCDRPNDTHSTHRCKCGNEHAEDTQ